MPAPGFQSPDGEEPQDQEDEPIEGKRDSIVIGR